MVWFVHTFTFTYTYICFTRPQVSTANHASQSFIADDEDELIAAAGARVRSDWRRSTHQSETNPRTNGIPSTKGEMKSKKEGKTTVQNRDNKENEEAKNGNNTNNRKEEVEEWFERYDDEGGYMYYYNAKTGGSLPYPEPFL